MMAAMLGVAEDMRMPALHLVANAVDDVVQREYAGFLGHVGVEDDLELQIAKLVGERVHIVARDGVGDLIGFFDRVGRDGREMSARCPIRSRLTGSRSRFMIATRRSRLKRRFSIEPCPAVKSESMIIYIM